MRENAHLYIRHDAHRFLRPDAPGWVHPDHKLWNPFFRYREEPQPHRSRAAAAVVESRAAERGEQVRRSRPATSELLKLKSNFAALRVQLAVIRHEIATRKARGRPPLTESDEGWQIILKSLARFQAECRKAGFNPAQPRVPAGNPDGGQWTSAGGTGDAGTGGGTGGGSDTGSGINDPRVLSDATPDNDWISGARYAQAESEGKVILAAGRGGIAKELLKLSVREFVSRYCRGSINRELPSQFNDISIAELFEIAKGGDAAARACAKLLKEQRIRK